MSNHYDEESTLRKYRRMLAEAGYPSRLIDNAMKLVGIPPSRKMLMTLLKARKICVTATEAIEYARNGGRKDAAGRASVRRHAIRLAISAAVLIAVGAMVVQLAKTMPGLQMEDTSLPYGWSINDKEHTDVSAYDPTNNSWTYWNSELSRSVSTRMWRYDSVCRKPIILDCSTGAPAKVHDTAGNAAQNGTMLLIPVNYKYRLEEFIRK